jgi:hypothetical protein
MCVVLPAECYFGIGDVQQSVVRNGNAMGVARQIMQYMLGSSPWLNQVERFFALITGRMIRRGTFHSAQELEMAIYHWLGSWNGDPAPFVWKASADVILDKVRRCKELSKTGD